jgi:selenium metabolism protein YedF
MPDRERVILISSDSLGRPGAELGRVLILALLNTLAEGPALPGKILLSNGGVRLACIDEDAIAALRKLETRGVAILACGTCLGFFELKERLQVGRVSNAREILNAMMEGDTVTWS